MTRRARASLATVVALAACLAVSAESPELEGASARWVLAEDPSPTVGDPVDATLEVVVPRGLEFEPRRLGPELGSFRVLEGSWSEADVEGPGERWAWRGKVAAYRTGEAELPAVDLVLRTADGARRLRAEPVAIEIRTVLEPGEIADAGDGGEPEIADLKAPAALEADYRPLVVALVVLAALALLAFAVYWAHRRYAGRLSSVPVSTDPFDRVPPDVWVYGELKRLLESRWLEAGDVDRFFEALARLMKRYHAARYRVDLIEHTTDEVAERLRQGGAPAEAVEALVRLLERCDAVKFARERPAPDACREWIDRAYAIVDSTKPGDAARRAHDGADATPSTQGA